MNYISHTISNWKKSLYLLSGFSCSLYAARILITDTYYFGFLVWNLFLAIVPLYFASLLYLRLNKQSTLISMLWFFFWLLFLPNSSYIITDLIHLKDRPGIPMWYDALMVFSFAFTGLLSGVISTYLIHQVLKKYLSTYNCYVTLGLLFLLSGFGVYLGRVERWNSWDLFLQPVQIIKDSIYMLTKVNAIGMTLGFGLLLCFCYVLFISFIEIKHDTSKNN
ncbi:MAG TPA: DUF1361 domain-containing protein [Cytophagaceae bacterium]